MLKNAVSRRRALHARDLANVDGGMYPRELLFGFPVPKMKSFRGLVRDTPDIVLGCAPATGRTCRTAWTRRATSSDHRRTPTGRRTATSASTAWSCTSLGVELLFRGMADVMRRQVIPLITRHAREVAARSPI